MEEGLAVRIATSLKASADRLLDGAATHLPDFVAAGAVLFVFWILASITRRLTRLGNKYVDDPTRRNLIRQVSYYAVWAIGVGVALDVLGVDARALVTGLGLGGVALGFALKDILSNIVSGLLILLSRTFEIGDQIVVGETEGTVERIELRATHIRTYDGRLILVPNAEVFTSRVTNNTASQLRRGSVFVYLNYREDLHHALSVALEAMAEVDSVAIDPAASMRLGDLRPECLQIEARFWTDSRRTDFMNTASAVRIAIVTALKKEGVALPNPDDLRVALIDPSEKIPEAPPVGNGHRSASYRSPPAPTA